MLAALGFRGWIYREGRERSFLSLSFDAGDLIGRPEGVFYARGYFDAEGGIPQVPNARLYVQLVQKERESLTTLRNILESSGIVCGRLHNPSTRVDPQLWRFYVRARSLIAFMTVVSSWHPRKRRLIESRLEVCADQRPGTAS